MRRLPSTAAPAVEFCLLIGMLLAVWEAVVRLSGISPWLLPAPSGIGAALWEDRALLWGHLHTTLQEALLGFLAAVSAGWATGAAMVSVPAVRRVLYPVLVATQTIPFIALAPLLVLWFGYGMFAKIVLVAFVTYFPISVAVVDGMDSVRPEQRRLLRALGANGRQLFWKLLAPAALPRLFTGLRVGGTYAVLAAVVAEWMGAERGLGLFLTRSANAYETDSLFAGIAVIALLSLGLFAGIGAIERFATPWKHRDRPYGRALTRD